MRAYDDNENELDAVFFVESVDGRLDVVLESRGPQRNPAHLESLDVILTRLAHLGTTLADALVDSRVSRDLPLALRRIIDGPIQLDLQTDTRTLRTRMTQSAARIGRRPGARGPDNRTKRVRFAVEVPGFDTGDPGSLEVALARGPETFKPFEGDAGDMLRDLIGVHLTTISGRPN